MKILIIGAGGREHALAWKLGQSKKVKKIFVAPGNGGTASEYKCENIAMTLDPSSAEGQKELVQFALSKKIDITVVGPELPLAMGIADTFRAAGLNIIGPGKEAAQLEASKIYSKTFMTNYGIRTAIGSKHTNLELALIAAAEHFKNGEAVTGFPAPLVIKADGLAAGKGVIIAPNNIEAVVALRFLMEHKALGGAGTSVLLEEFLTGTEVSILAAVSVRNGKGFILPFVSARDHKRRYDKAMGPNTGGMGAIAPVRDFSPALQHDFIHSIMEPTLKGMIAENMDYCGFIFFGLMIQNDRCYLLEYNVRLGDPEAQAVLPLMDFDLVDLCTAMLAGRDFFSSLKWKKGAICAPVAVADGYPGTYRCGDPITIDAAALAKTGAQVFINGATGVLNVSNECDGSALRTSGGRVLTISAHGANADEAYTKAYAGLDAIKFNGISFRTDIGKE